MIPAFQEVFRTAPPGNQLIDFTITVTRVTLIGVTVIGLLFIIYPIAALIVMLRPSIAAAFRGELPAPDYEEGRFRQRHDDNDEPDASYRPDGRPESPD
jgi:hypothetical protein